jgi:hypothetical protein
MSLGITNRASTSTLYIRAFKPLAALRSSRAFCTSRLLPRRSLRATTKHDQHTTPSRHYCTKADACAYCRWHSGTFLHAYESESLRTSYYWSLFVFLANQALCIGRRSQSSLLPSPATNNRLPHHLQYISQPLLALCRRRLLVS